MLFRSDLNQIVRSERFYTDKQRIVAALAIGYVEIAMIAIRRAGDEVEAAHKSMNSLGKSNQGGAK